MWKNPRFLENPLADGAEVVSLTSRPRSTHQKHVFCFRCSLLFVSELEGLDKLKHSVSSSGLGRDLLACSIVRTECNKGVQSTAAHALEASVTGQSIGAYSECWSLSLHAKWSSMR
jgi:hypothetical protein